MQSCFWIIVLNRGMLSRLIRLRDREGMSALLKKIIPASMPRKEQNVSIYSPFTTYKRRTLCMGFSQMGILYISVVNGISLRKQIAEGGVRLEGARVEGNGNKTVSSFGLGPGFLPSTGLIASDLKLFDFSSS